MEKKTYPQLELFSITDSHSENKVQISNSLSTYIRNYEKIILIIVGFMVIGVVSFCLGVEKGKKIGMLKTDSYLDTARLKTQPATYKLSINEKQYQIRPTSPMQRDVTIPKKETKTIIEKKDVTTKEPQKRMYNYTVQVASYQTKRYAEKEAEILKKRGLSPLILSKGKFNIVCVGNFSSKETAEPLLSELKKRYQDCLIRRL